MPAGTRRLTASFSDQPIARNKQIADPHLTVRRLCIAANRVRSETELARIPAQLSLFSDPETEAAREAEAEKERRQQEAILAIRKKYGKNAIVKAMNLQEAGTAMDRNAQVGGHKA